VEDLLIAILQGLFEFALEVLANVPFDWPLSTRNTSEPRSLPIACFLWFVGGCLLGSLSVLLLKHTWIRFSPLRIANLPLAPLVSAYIAQAIARRRQETSPQIVPRNHFWKVFSFSLGLVAVRFAYATRPH